VCGDGGGGMKHILSFGAGVNSTALLIELLNRNMPLDYILFADTGEEVPETYSHLKHIQDWLRSQNKEIVVVQSKYGLLYDYYHTKKTIPYRNFRDCTDKFKKRPQNEFIKQFKKEGVVQYIGIALEEFHRMKTSDIKWITWKYPLVEWRIDRSSCIKIIEKAGLPIPVKSGCYMCPFQSDESWARLFNSKKELWLKSRALEEDNRSYPRNTLRWAGTLRDLEKAIRTQTKLSDFSEPICGGHCFT
jgi:hypothetical protein